MLVYMWLYLQIEAGTPSSVEVVEVVAVGAAVLVETVVANANANANPIFAHTIRCVVVRARYHLTQRTNLCSYLYMSETMVLEMILNC